MRQPAHSPLLREQLSTQDSRSERRPNATGNNGAEQTTDC